MGNELITIGVLAIVGGGLLVYSLMPRRQDARDAVKRRLSGKGGEQPSIIKEQARAQARENLVKKATPMLTRLIMPVSDDERNQLREKLMMAGFRQRTAQTLFLASKTACLAVGLIIGLISASALGYTTQGFIGVTLTGAGIGFMLPGFWLGFVTSSRQDRIRRGLPDILDLMVVSIESGLALDSAIKRVGEEMERVHPDLSEEFRISTRESQMGIPRSEALDNMAQRVGVDELRSLISVIAQAERFGTSIAKALRNQSETLRSKRRLQAEEKAQKTAVKLMIPLVLFIFPAMGIVLAGPAAIKLMEAF
ncbi:MAG: type II secretion system F family protein [Phycisphaerales bacterium]|nr:type II secretion system F family protein [Phycisphaerales bacterium]